MADKTTEKVGLLTEGTPNSGATKRAQILLRRKMNTQWESFTEVIPEGEPCFSYDASTGDYVLKIGAKDINGNLQMWHQLNLLRGRVDDGELT